VVCRLYYRGREQGYDDGRSVSTVIQAMDRVLDVRFRLSAAVRPDYLRLDFSDFPGIYELRQVALKAGDGREVILEGLPGRLGFVHGEWLPSLDGDGLRMAGFDNDPYLEFEVGSVVSGLASEELEVNVRIGYELVLDDPVIRGLLERHALSVRNMSELSRDRIDMREAAGFFSRQQSEMNERLGRLERNLASRNIWSWLRRWR
jgi:hypothetical protein